MNQRAIPQTESISNLTLIDGSARVVEYLVSRIRPSYFRIGRESHLILLRVMVEALRGSANLEVLDRSKDKTHSVKYHLADGPWKEIHKEIVPNCKKAWRYSAPITCQPPSPAQLGGKALPQKEHLLSFYDLLARVQAEYCMCRTFGGHAATIADDDLRELEWLHEGVRNEFEHYVPKTYVVGVAALLKASSIALRLSEWLLLSSGSVRLYRPHRSLRVRISRLHRRVARLLARSARV